MAMLQKVRKAARHMATKPLLQMGGSWPALAMGWGTVLTLLVGGTLAGTGYF